MSDWLWLIGMLLQGLFCWAMGVNYGESKNAFKPTQETWLELEKFRWTHKCVTEDDEE